MESCLTRHHRKPRAQGGSNKSYNISLVRELDHRMWHTLFDGTLSVQMIAIRMNRPEVLIGKQAAAWDHLFGHLTPNEISRRVTEIWIDPSYKILYGVGYFAVRT